MARKQSIFDDILVIAARLPWWLGVVLAIITYFIFHYFATSPAPVVENMKGPKIEAPVIYHLLAKSFSMFLQYMIPAALIFGAITSAISQIRNRNVYNSVTQSKNQTTVRSLSWLDFERLLNEAFKRQGYSVRDTNKGPDGGVDLVLNKDGKKIFVQCKHWKTKQVGVGVVRELLGVVTADKASGGIAVTSGKFTSAAHAFAKRSGIELIDGAKLNLMLELPNEDVSGPNVQPPDSRTHDAPSCPECGKTMVWRKAKRGAKAGSVFWGCLGFPNCRGTRPI